MLTPQHWRTLSALMDRIIPPDAFPGAWEAGVGDYLLGQFERDLRSQVDVYQQGLEALEGEAVAVLGTGFALLDGAGQDYLLRRVELGEVVTAWPVEPAGFFQKVTAHVMEGYYSDPGNGGNRGEIAWRMIGFSGVGNGRFPLSAQ